MANAFQISDPDFWDKINFTFGIKGGVYRLYSNQSGRPAPVPRLLDTDTEGILYIGKASSFLDRVIALKKSIIPEYHGKSHVCGRRYKRLREITNIAEKYPHETLYVELIPDDNPELLESTLLYQYECRFGEVPPLNAVSVDIKPTAS